MREMSFDYYYDEQSESFRFLRVPRSVSYTHLGIPYSTITGFYAKGYDKMKLSTLKTLARFFGVSTDYLGRDEITDPNYGLTVPEAPALAPDEYQLLDDYRTFNDEGKEKIRDYIADLKDNPKYKKCSESRLDKKA